MLRATPIALTLAALLALPACTPAAKPAEAPREKPTVEVTVTPAESVQSSAAALAASYLKPMAPQFEAVALHSYAEAAQTFSGMLAPRDTLGRALVAIVYEHATDGSDNPRETLRIVYEGRLVVSEQWRMSRIRHPIVPNATRETTTVGGSSAEVEYVMEGTERWAVVRWQADHLTYDVRGPGLTKAEAMRIAHSMVP